VNEAADLLTNLGHKVVLDMPAVAFDEVSEYFLPVWAAGVCSAISTYAAVIKRFPGLSSSKTPNGSYTSGNGSQRRPLLGHNYPLQQFTHRIIRVHLAYDLTLSTVTAKPAPLLWATFSQGTPIANLIRQPLISIPLSHTNDAVPLTGRYSDDTTVLALIGQLEIARKPMIVQPRKVLN
jgi:amidase